MSSLFIFILSIVVLVLLVLMFRLIGAWMFRINEIIDLQKQMLAELKKQKLN